MAQAQSAAGDDAYTIRLARSGDSDAFLALYEDVWSRSRSRAWFDWRFRENPYSDDVEMVVAETDERLVGAEPLLALPLAAGDGSVPVRQPVDWIVHPDHRRRGVFTRMTERLLSAYEDRAALLFNFPSEALRPGLQQFDWTDVSRVATRYRVQAPGRVVDDLVQPKSTAASVLGRVGAPAGRAYLDTIDRFASSRGDVSVERSEGVDAQAIRTVYVETRPDAIHVPRERAFLDWRFGNPRWDAATYVARRGGNPVATILAVTERVGETQVVQLLDVQPMQTTPERTPAFAAALDRVLDDYADAALLKAPGQPFPRVFRRRGFFSDDSFPLGRFATATAHVVRPFPGGEDAFDREVFDGEDWLLALGDRDIE